MDPHVSRRPPPDNMTAIIDAKRSGRRGSRRKCPARALARKLEDFGGTCRTVSATTRKSASRLPRAQEAARGKPKIVRADDEGTRACTSSSAADLK